MTANNLAPNSPDTQAVPAPEAEAPILSPEKQFIKLFLAADTPLLLSVLSLVEILTVPINQIVPMFQLPAWVAGVYNRRGDILWVIDLNHLSGLEPWYQQDGYPSKHTVLVLRGTAQQAGAESSEVVLGLIVNQIDNIVTCEPEQVTPTEGLTLPGNLGAFLKGQWHQDDQDSHWMLNGEAILEAMPTASST